MAAVVAVERVTEVGTGVDVENVERPWIRASARTVYTSKSRTRTMCSGGRHGGGKLGGSPQIEPPLSLEPPAGICGS